MFKQIIARKIATGGKFELFIFTIECSVINNHCFLQKVRNNSVKVSYLKIRIGFFQKFKLSIQRSLSLKWKD